MKKGNFLTILKKIFKRLEKNTSVEAYIWAKNNTSITTEEFCRNIDDLLYNDVITDVNHLIK